MGISGARFRGNAIVKGRPKEHAQAEISLMRERQRIEDRKRRMKFFMFLDIVLVISLIVSIYSFYRRNIVNGFLTLLVGLVILFYFLIRKIVRKKR